MRCRCFHCILLWERSLLPDGGCDCLSGVITRMWHSKLHSQGQQVQGPSSVMPERGAGCYWPVLLGEVAEGPCLSAEGSCPGA